MDTSDTSYNSFEQFIYEVINFVNFAYFEDFLELGEEKSLFDTVGEWPVLKKTFQKWNG